MGDPVAKRLWEHALATALAADELWQIAGQARGGDGFIAGLLHDIGKLVFHLANAAAFACLAPFDGPSEIRAFGVTHPEMGGYLLNNWGSGTYSGQGGWRSPCPSGPSGAGEDCSYDGLDRSQDWTRVSAGGDRSVTGG